MFNTKIMNKDLRTELKKIATEILLLKDDAELEMILKKVRDLYEKVVILKNLNNKQELLVNEESNALEIVETDDREVVDVKIDSSVNKEIEEEPSLEVKSEVSEIENIVQDSEQLHESNEKEVDKAPVSLNDLFVPTFDSIKDDMSQKAEFKDTISLEETEKLFETKRGEPQQLSLNDKLVNSSIQIGLNDRIAFVNKLFNFSQTEFNTVLSKLNGCSNKQEALHYIQYKVKPKYNWKDKEELEERLIFIIERKFL